MTTSDTPTRRVGEAGEPEDGGRMPLAEHLRELRSRIIKSMLAVVLFTAIAWAYYDQLFALIQHPLDPVIAKAEAAGRKITLNFNDITGPFMTQLKISLLAGVIAASPVWIYQLWRFITPGMHRHEKKWTVVAMASTVPLFLLGVVLGYLLLPKGLQLLLGFAPQDTSNLLTVDLYISFFIRTILVFGVAFLTPVFIVALNFAGILTAKTLQAAWRWIVMAVFLFAAIATPSQDPWTMLALALPMLTLVFIALGICWLNDRRRYRSQMDYSDLDDDEASPIAAPEPVGSADDLGADDLGADDLGADDLGDGTGSGARRDDDWT
jgi:sec-independent protein translocase protein TatC